MYVSAQSVSGREHVVVWVCTWWWWVWWLCVVCVGYVFPEIDPVLLAVDEEIVKIDRFTYSAGFHNVCVCTKC